MTVLQLRGPMGFCVLQWCHPMLACTKRTSYCTRIITLYGARKVDSGPRTPRAWGKRSARDSRPPPSSRDSKTQELRHIYTEADSTAEYLLPTPLNAPISPRDPSRGIPSSSGQPLAIPQLKPKPHGSEPTKNIFARWIEKKTQTSKNLGTV